MLLSAKSGMALRYVFILTPFFIDRLFSFLYEDKVMERITERNFEMMSGKYQKEQPEIEARLKEVTETLTDSYEKSQGIRDFLRQTVSAVSALFGCKQETASYRGSASHRLSRWS